MSAEGWNHFKFEDICTKIGSGATPTGGANAYKNAGISLIRSQNVRDFSFSNEGLAFIDDEQAEKLKSVTVSSGDVLLNITGDSVARSCIVTDEVLPARVNQHVSIIRVNESLSNNKFVFYYTQHIKPYLLSLAGNGATRNALTKAMIEQLDILLPPLPEQRAIAATLAALDDKIELNNRINKTLEEIAQALFKRWFVDFEFPDENGQPFKSAGGELEESELGPIPKGWKVGNFFNLTNDSVGGDWGKDSTQGKYVCEVFCIRGADIPELDSGKTGKMPTRFILQKNFEAKVLNENDIVIEISGGSPTQSTGRMVLISKELIRRFSNPLICSNFCRKISLKNEIYAEFLYMYLNVLYKNEVFFQFENGTTGIKNLDVNNLFDKYQIVLPNQEIVANFQSIIKESRRIIQENGRETQVLINIRDALLPKLMSGEIRVPIEEVAADV